VDPYVADAARARTRQGAIEQLRAAVRKEPRVVERRFDLAIVYERARDWKSARRTLLEAKRLDPGEPRIDEALRRLP
jgi:Flp pilus assembly protein TadD